MAPSHNQETLRSALGDTLEHHSEGLPLNPHRSLNVSPRAQRRVSDANRSFAHNLTATGKASVYQVAPSHNQETLRSALGDTLEYHSEGLPLNPHRSPNVSPRAKRRVSDANRSFAHNLTAMGQGCNLLLAVRNCNPILQGLNHLPVMQQLLPRQVPLGQFLPLFGNDIRRRIIRKFGIPQFTFRQSNILRQFR